MKRIMPRIASAFVVAALAMAMVPAAAFGAAGDGSTGESEGGGSPAVVEGDLQGGDVSSGLDAGPVDGSYGNGEGDALSSDELPDAVEPIDEASVEPEVVLEPQAATDNVTVFVTRLYDDVLDRTPEPAGLAVQVAYLRNGGTAASLAWNFFSSAEFAKRFLNNEQRVCIAYEALLGRAPDANGLAGWMAKLDSGMSMRAIVAGFCQSSEFRALCAKWGVVPGTLGVTEARDRNDSVTAFVQRLYQEVLKRRADTAGLNLHASTILSGGSAANLAWSFLGSAEFAKRSLTDEQRVETAYQAMLGRGSDAAGKRMWTGKLATGMSMRAVVSGFSESPEFRALCSKWGIKAGTLGVTEPRDKNQNVTAFVQRLYQKVLGRNADTGGLNVHTNSLLSGAGAASTAWQFFSSPEFAKMNLSNADKVEIAYQTLLGRGSDAAGKAGWTEKMDKGMPLYSLISGFAQSNEFRKFCTSYDIKVGTVSGDAELDSILDTIISQRGSNLRSLFDYVASYPYVKGSTYPTGNWSVPFAKEMYRNGGGNCYRYAALFCELAKAVGYDAKVVSGHVPSRSMGQTPHGWVEIRSNGTTYVCDPDMVHAYPTRNWYMFTYNNAPMNYIR